MRKDGFVVGIDGGGTKTIVRLADKQGNTLAEKTGGASNIQVSGAETSSVLLFDLILDVCRIASVSVGQLCSVAAGVAGAGRRNDIRILNDHLRTKLLEHGGGKVVLTVASDAEIALEATFGDQPGTIVIAGTGSIIYGRQPDGRIERMGGWGPLLGDPGSGTDIGIKALQKLADMFDGRCEVSQMMNLFSNSFGINSPESLIHKVYDEQVKPSTLTRPVFEAAGNNDRNALDVLDAAAGGLVDLLRDYLARFVNRKEIRVSLKGGMLENDNVYSRIVVRKITESCPGVMLIRSDRKSINGAVRLALRTADQYISASSG